VSQQNSIEIVDKNGWRKIYPLPEKLIIHIGSDPKNDIVLAGEYGANVYPIHAQLVAAAEAGSGYHLVNLADADIALGPPGGQMLAARSSVNVTDGQTFVLGEFTLVFHGEGGFFGGPVSSNSEHIGLRLTLPQAKLGPNQSLEGAVTVGNLSQLAGVQFELELEGLDDDCYDLEPGPLLSSGAEKDVLLRLYHRGTKPLAGDCRLTIRATAPRSYPGEQATVFQTIRVLPYYRHRVSLLPPDGSGVLPQADEDATAKPESIEQEQPAPLLQTVPAAAATSGVVAEITEASPTPQPKPERPEETWWSASPEPIAQTIPAYTPQTQADTPTEDWWTIPTETEPAEAMPIVQPEAEASSEAEVSGEDWWTSPAEASPAEEATPAPTMPQPEADVSKADVSKVDASKVDASKVDAPKTEAPETDTLKTDDSAEDWWATPAETGAPPETPLKMEAQFEDDESIPDWWVTEAVKPPQAKPETSDAGEDGWGIETTESSPPLQLKAEPMSVAQTAPQTIKPEADSETEVPDWWAAEEIEPPSMPETTTQKIKIEEKESEEEVDWWDAEPAELETKRGTETSSETEGS
jgi:hypothetical protein